MARAESLVSAAIVLVAGLALVPLLPEAGGPGAEALHASSRRTQVPAFGPPAVASHVVTTPGADRPVGPSPCASFTKPPPRPTPTPTPPEAPPDATAAVETPSLPDAPSRARDGYDARIGGDDAGDPHA